ncbi:tRNA 2-thiouridine(34) synthase MnmA [Enorma massiliensis]|uniref:tRNA 2-thiouridine(34) synthase MnmA n=1 Tax=Enorma massiliensis TaxID=1472761 RepID=UPI003A928CDA
MSGGVDSSVTAYLLSSAGYDCIGVTMRLYDAETSGRDPARACGNLADIEDARAVASRLGIPFTVLDCRAAFERDVIEAFTRAYELGTTPNPCAICNQRIKFGALLAHARELGCEYLATGHYARVAQLESGSFALMKAVDRSKDQSYFLYGLTQEELAHVLFPLGGLTKQGDVRRIAREHGFENAAKRDSQGICFVPDNDFATFIERRRGQALPDGDIVDTSGSVLGTHHGAIRYTVGQRKGLGVAAARPLYVTGIDARANTVTLGDEADLMSGALIADSWTWSAPAPDTEARLDAAPLRAAARIRYHQADQAVRVRRALPPECAAGPVPVRGEALRIDFDEPQRAVAPGQAVVLYDGDVVLGGGRILCAAGA